jgi:hypothetical protein
VSTHGLQLEESILNQGEFHGRRAFPVVVGHVVDASAHRIAAHPASIESPQHFRRRTHILHSGIEPQVVGIRIKNDWHAVVDG